MADFFGPWEVFEVERAIAAIEAEAVAARNAEIAAAVREKQGLICDCRFPDCPRLAAVLAIVETP